uniref:Uncharacterized protein n=1 Tax=Pelusios castaneus TaxID=367368 RepID=A0A8C8VJ49_9SAUR
MLSSFNLSFLCQMAAQAGALLRYSPRRELTTHFTNAQPSVHASQGSKLYSSLNSAGRLHLKQPEHCFC